MPKVLKETLRMADSLATDGERADLVLCIPPSSYQSHFKDSLRYVRGGEGRAARL